jgi:AcrR family transcriptional regulator
MLAAARRLFGERGIDGVSIAEIAEAAQVSPATFYKVFKSREGVVSALMEEALFNAGTADALRALEGLKDPVEAIRRTAAIARNIYDGESREFGGIRDIAGWSPTLRRVEGIFDERRMAMQAPRIDALFDAGRARPGLSREEAARLLWMYTSRDVYRLLTVNGNWSSDRYEAWLSDTLAGTLAAR